MSSSSYIINLFIIPYPKCLSSFLIRSLRKDEQGDGHSATAVIAETLRALVDDARQKRQAVMIVASGYEKKK